MRYVDGMNRNQMLMVNLDELVSSSSECRVIDCFCESLEMNKLGFKHAVTKDEGRPPFDPKDLLKLYLYGYLNRTSSSGMLAREATRNIEVIWLLRGQTPSKRTMCYFKEHNRSALRSVFLEFNKFYRHIGLFGKDTVALDSVKVKAQNSKKKNYNKETVDRTLERTATRIDEYLAILDVADKNEGYDEKHNLTSEQVQEIIDKLQAKKEKFNTIKDSLQNSPDKQISTTDPDSRCMKQGSGKGMDISYNTQVVAEADSKMIVDYETTNNAFDKGHLEKMGKEAKDFLQADRLNLLADTGYHSGKEMLAAEASGITCIIPKGKTSNQKNDPDYHREKFIFNEEENMYTCPCGQELHYMRQTKDGNDIAFIYANYSACSKCPNREKCTAGKYRQLQRKSYQTEVDKLDERFIQCKGEYKKRQEIIEHPFGTIKWVWGFNRYQTRGIQAVAAENALLFSAYNLRRAINIYGAKRLIEEMKTFCSRLFCYFKHLVNLGTFLDTNTSLIAY